MSVQDTLAALKAALAKSSALPDDVAKAFTQSGSATTGLTFYDLEAPAKTLYPVLTPLRNKIPRVVGGRGIQANWKAITGINTNNVGIGISEGKRGGIIATTVADYFAAFRFLGLDDYVTFEADFSAEGFDDVNARAKEGLLRSLMIGEELLDLGGNTSVALGTTPTPSLAASGSGTSLTNVAYYVHCVALTLEAFMRSSVAGGIPETATRNLAGGETDSYKGGHAQISTQATVTPTAGQQIAATVTPVAGAAAYAWFWGTSTGATVLGAITTIPSVVITALAAGSQVMTGKFGSDQSQNDKVYDGYLSLAQKSGSGSYIKRMAAGTPGTGTGLTSDTAGGIVEFEEALASFWDNWKLSPETIWVSSQEMGNLQKKVLAATSTAAQRFVFTIDQNGGAAGVTIRSYLNRYGMTGEAQAIPIRIHPNMPKGTVLFETSKLPYALSGVPDVVRKLLRRDYYAIDWPLVQRKREYGVYFDGVLQHYFTPSLGVITGIGNA